MRTRRRRKEYWIITLFFSQSPFCLFLNFIIFCFLTCFLFFSLLIPFFLPVPPSHPKSVSLLFHPITLSLLPPFSLLPSHHFSSSIHPSMPLPHSPSSFSSSFLLPDFLSPPQFTFPDASCVLVIESTLTATCFWK